MQTPAARGLTAAELNLAIEELRAYSEATVLDAVALQGTGGHNDVLLVLQPSGDGARKVFVHVALGGPRARITTTQRRFGRDARARGPGADMLLRELQDATFAAIEAVQGERRCTFLFDTSNGQRQLVIELFGARGLWLLGNETGEAMTMSRAVETAVRTLRRGDIYVPPPPTPAVAASSKSPLPDRFTKPVLDSIDAHFTPLDLDKEQAHAEGTLRLLVERNRKRSENKVQGMQRQLDNVERVQQMRSTADLMLAYAHSVARGADNMEVPSLDGDSTVKIPLDPSKPVAIQANKLYDKARRQEEGRAMTEKRLATAQTECTELQSIAELFKEPSEANLETIGERLQALGLMPKPKLGTKKTPGKSRKKGDEAVPFRRFSSTEGYPIFVGRNNNQNDELTMRYAKGNDLWLHVGGGRPGSHVVVRLPKQKTASLETLLDAATLAVYYSKSRGEPRIEVIYTFKKHIKKPKGLPAGAVVPAHTKTVTVLADKQRLSRLLATSATSQD
jgi:predicted ribosome quality control (RQC) complex YloA/Tae2 family protein